MYNCEENVSEGSKFYFPIMQYVTQYDLVTDLNEDSSLPNIKNFIVLCPAVAGSNHNLHSKPVQRM